MWASRVHLPNPQETITVWRFADRRYGYPQGRWNRYWEEQTWYAGCMYCLATCPYTRGLGGASTPPDRFVEPSWIFYNHHQSVAVWAQSEDTKQASCNGHPLARVGPEPCVHAGATVVALGRTPLAGHRECHGHHEKPYGCDRDRAHLVVRMGAVMETFPKEDLAFVARVCSTRCGSDRASHGAGSLRFRLVNAVTAKHVAEVVFNLAISPRCSRNPTRVRSVEAVSASELVSIGTAAA